MSAHDFFESSCNPSCNSYRPSRLGKVILKAISDSQIELTPKQIADSTGKNHSSVKVCLRRLLEHGLVIQPYPGAYCNKITYRVRFAPLLVHNIRLRGFVVGGVEHWECREQVGDVRVFVCFGAERRKVSGWIACDCGMTKDACLLALHRWFDLVEERLGYALKDFELLSFEQNKDYVGLRLDGAQCVTKEGLFGMVERIYQKEENVVRHEHKMSEPMSVNAFETFLSSGVGGFNVNQAVFELKREIASLVKAQKFGNQRVLELVKLQEAMYRAMLPKNESKQAKPLGGEDYAR